MTENEISNIVFDAGMRIHRKLGVGLYENVYEECLAYELNGRGLLVEKQRDVKIEYEELIIDKAFRIDLLIEKS